MYRLAICDDEPIFLDIHRALAASILDEAGISHEITAYARAEDLARRLRDQPDSFDMLMLDILFETQNGVNIPSETGILLARSLRATGFHGGILFATSSKDFALEGYSVYPVHYLLKPVGRAALREALLRDYRKRFEPPALALPVKGGHTAIPLDAVLYIESLLRTVIIHTKDRDIETETPLRDIKALLPGGVFAQCHKSLLVPMSKIRDITRAEITLVTGQCLPVGRVFYAEALTAFIDYMEGR